jgi:hypothetical protein
VSGLVPVTGAAAAGRRIAGLLLDRGVPVRAFAPTQDHSAEQLRQPGAEVAAGDLREIADVIKPTQVNIRRSVRRRPERLLPLGDNCWS